MEEWKTCHDSQWFKANYIALYHPTGKLWMSQDLDRETGEVEYFFEFTGLDDYQKDIIDITAHSLAITNRFGGQSALAYSVLRHSFYVGKCLELAGYNSEIVFGGLMHDMSEAYFADVPRPFKTDEDRKREAAIMKATPWKCLYGDLCHEGVVKQWDTIALIVEAERYGHPQWTWTDTYRQSGKFASVDLDLYGSTMQLYENFNAEEIKEHWIGMVTDAESTF